MNFNISEGEITHTYYVDKYPKQGMCIKLLRRSLGCSFLIEMFPFITPWFIGSSSSSVSCWYESRYADLYYSDI